MTAAIHTPSEGTTAVGDVWLCAIRGDQEGDCVPVDNASGVIAQIGFAGLIARKLLGSFSLLVYRNTVVFFCEEARER